MALSTTQYGYIIDPMVPFTDDKGKTIKNGFVRVFVAGSSTPVVTYRNFDGAANQDRIELDNSGRTKTSVIGSKGFTYKVCVYDKHHSQESPILTVDKVSIIGANITAGAGATLVTGLDGLTTKPDGFVDASVVGTDGYVALDHTLVTDDLDTDAKVDAVEDDRYIPLLNEDVNDPDSKMTLGRLWQWVLGKIKSLSTTITAFRSGDYIAVDGPSGTAKMSKDDLLKETAQNARENIYSITEITPTYVDNYFISSSGEKTYNTNWKLSDPIQVNAGDIIEFTASTASSVAVIASVENGIYTPLCVSTGIADEVFRHCFSFDTKVVICCYKTATRKPVIKVVADIDEQINNLAYSIIKKDVITLSYTTGYFIDASGNKNANANYELSQAIAMKSGESIKFVSYGLSTNVAVLSEYDALNDVYTPLVISNNERSEFVYTAEKNCSVVVCARISDAGDTAEVFTDKFVLSAISRLFEKSHNVEASTSRVSLTWTANYFVNKFGYLTYNTNYSYTEITLKPNSSIKITTVVTSANAVATLSKKIATGLYEPIHINTTTSNETFSYTNTGYSDEVLIIVTRTNKIFAALPLTKVSVLDGVNASLAKIPNNNEKLTFASFALFPTFGVIGDSYASGELYKEGGTKIGDVYDKSWGQILARFLGNTCTNFSKGGLTTKTWLTDNKGLPLLQSDTAKDVYICALEINDISKGDGDGHTGKDYLGTIADINDGDPSLNADTFYGNYGRIIAAILAKNSNAKIVLMANPKNDTSVYRAYNEAIEEIADHYSVCFIDQKDDPFFICDNYNDMYHSHPTQVSYSGMAMAINRLLTAAMDGDYHHYFCDVDGYPAE